MKRLLIVLVAVLLLWCAAADAADYQRRIYRDGREVDVKTVGAYQTVIRSGGREELVPSAELTWESDTDVRFGYLYAPKRGKVNIRLAPKPKASVLVKGETGRLVFVISRDEEWTGILYDGLIGYVQNSTIRLVEEPEAPKSTATLSYKGNTRVTTKVTMRSEANQSSRAVVGLRPGAPVTIFKLGTTWSEVEVSGWHGFVLTQHLTDIVPVEESLPSAEEDTPPDDGIPVLDTTDTIVEEINLD